MIAALNCDALRGRPDRPCRKFALSKVSAGGGRQLPARLARIGAERFFKTGDRSHGTPGIDPGGPRRRVDGGCRGGRDRPVPPDDQRDVVREVKRGVKASAASSAKKKTHPSEPPISVGHTGPQLDILAVRGPQKHGDHVAGDRRASDLSTVGVCGSADARHATPAGLARKAKTA